MAVFKNVTLELIRPGPPHNQLLSPLTPYMALCGEGSPVTFHINLEHRKLLNRLRRLRYVAKEGSTSGVAVPDSIREAEVTELGEEVASILTAIKTLNSEISRAQGQGCASDVTTEAERSLVHLRLVLSGSELSLLPFELSIAPQPLPGEGLEFCLQGCMPVVITRETRRSGSLRINLDRPVEPRILFIAAEPDGMSVPKKAHVQALRQALEPWIRWPRYGGKPSDRVALVRERLRLLINPSIEEVYETCAESEYTHVHILAHGAAYEEAGEQRFGLALCQQRDKTQLNIVSGKRLAKALQAEFKDRPGRSQPLIVTLATCDSGNPGSLLVPGGSIAHDLHSEGIPWVFASQFPLTKRGSVRMADILYSRLLGGDDPRQVLYEVRRQLFMSADRDHDWASIIAYVTMPADAGQFLDQVNNFFDRQMKRAIEVGLDRADNCTTKKSRKDALDIVKSLLERWKDQLPTGKSVQEKDRARRAECFGLHGSVYKRIALSYRGDRKWEAKGFKPSQDYDKKSSSDDFKTSWIYYKKTMDEMRRDDIKYYWAATQYLCLSAVTEHGHPDEGLYLSARRAAEGDLEKDDRETQAWAHGTMAELNLLSLFHLSATNKLPPKQVETEVRKHCKKLVDLMGTESFHAKSTARQFKRYIDFWLIKKDDRDRRKIAQAAIDELSPKTATAKEEFPTY